MRHDLAQATVRVHERDRLTGLATAAGALVQIAGWNSAAASRGARPFVHAILVRLGNVSAVNLTHGAIQGDRILAEAAVRMLRFAHTELASPSLVARMAGDTFLLAADQAVSRERWQCLAESLGDLLARPIATARGAHVRLRPRIALSRSIPGELPAGLLSRLAETLDIAQSRSARRPVWVDGRVSPAGRSGEQLEGDLAKALEAGEIEIVYQPQISCAGGRIVGAEALARWRHPLLGPIGPDRMFGIAERGDQVEALSQRVLHAALSGAGTWPEDLRLSLNVTAADLSCRGFDAAIGHALEEAGFAPARLTLEITETALLCDLERAACRLHRLRALGIRIAFDDFGAGFCNFRYLKALPVDELKLDRSMVQGIAEDERDLAVLRGIVAMARALDLKVTAEGVETPAQRDAVAREGCTSWQGFLAAEPMSPADFAAYAIEAAC